MTYQIKLLILNSNSDIYINNEIIIVNIKRKIGEGIYGSIFELDNNNVIKIFKNSIHENTLLKETINILPYSNENRELIFFNKVIKEAIEEREATEEKNEDKNEDKKYIIKILAIGCTKNKIIDKKNIFQINSNFIIIPLANQFYDIIDKSTISNNNYKLVIDFMKRLSQICIFLEIMTLKHLQKLSG
jgi:hypothetical protein